MSKGFMEADLGTKVYANKLQKLSSMKMNESILVAILSKKVIIIKYHYAEGLRYVYCNESVCCSKLGLPSVRYVFPLLVYGLDKKGKVDPESNDWTVKPLVLSPKEYESILRKEEITGDIRSQDILITCTNAEYQHHDFDLVGDAKWKGIPRITEKIKEEVEYYKSNIKTALARELSDQEILTALAQGAGSQFAIDKPEVSVASVEAPSKEIKGQLVAPEVKKEQKNTELEETMDYNALFD